MLIAALMSRSWTAPQGQVHSRMCSGFFSPTTPHVEQVRVDGNQRSIRANYAIDGALHAAPEH
jgi:hypothetical protein